jgi:hypothetical protein
MPKLGYVNYGEIGITRAGTEWKNYNKHGPDGVPLALLDEKSGTVALLSPTSAFYDTVFDVVSNKNSSYLRCGLIGSAHSIPAGFSTETVMHFGEGMTSTFMSWGDALLRKYGKKRAPHNANVQVHKLGYSTVGHFFYGTESGENLEEALASVVDAATAQKLKFSYMLVDSFWYGEGATPLPNGGSAEGYGGTWRWDDKIARASNRFPSGLKAFTAKIGMPMVRICSDDAALI